MKCSDIKQNGTLLKGWQLKSSIKSFVPFWGVYSRKFPFAAQNFFLLKTCWCSKLVAAQKLLLLKIESTTPHCRLPCPPPPVVSSVYLLPPPAAYTHKTTDTLTDANTQMYAPALTQACAHTHTHIHKHKRMYRVFFTTGPPLKSLSMENQG